MSRARKWIAWILGGGAVLLLLLAGAAVLVVRSQWFYARVRAGIVKTVETATGGRVEIGAFRFDWHRLRAEVDDFTLHGAADSPNRRTSLRYFTPTRWPSG